MQIHMETRGAMEGKELDKVTAFDTLFTTNHIQMMKVLSSYLPPSSLQNLAIYIKVAELQYTLQLFHKHPHASLQLLPHEETFDTTKMCEEVLPFCSPAQQEHLQQMKNMMEQYKNMQDMMEMMKLMQELSGSEGNDSEGAGAGGFSGMPDNFADMLSMLSGMPNMF